MREGKIILPMQDNNGKRLSAEHNALLRELCDEFGGATMSKAIGSWVDNEQMQTEDVAVYVVAGHVSDNAALERLALKYGRMCRQKGMYLVYFDGAAEILWISETVQAN